MSSINTALVVFASVFGSALLGLSLGKVLPDRHLNNDAKDIVKLSMGLIATLTALVLGLLVSSAKDTFDQVNNELTQVSVKVVVLDRVLAQYGPETQQIRAEIKTSFAAAMNRVLSGNESDQAQLDTHEGFAPLETVQVHILQLSPKDDAQRAFQARALDITGQLMNSRWLISLQRKGTISMPLLVCMVFWLCIIFSAWGVFSPRNMVVTVALLLSSLAVSGATFLILEMDEPLTGLIRISGGPIQEALSRLGQ